MARDEEYLLVSRLPAYPLTRLPAYPLTRLPAYPYLPVHRAEPSTSSILFSSTVSAPGTPPHP